MFASEVSSLLVSTCVIISDTVVYTCRSVSLIDSECRHVNDKLRRLAAVVPDVASLSPLDYDCTSKRADVDVLQMLVESAKKLKVSERK